MMNFPYFKKWVYAFSAGTTLGQVTEWQGELSEERQGYSGTIHYLDQVHSFSDGTNTKMINLPVDRALAGAVTLNLEDGGALHQEIPLFFSPELDQLAFQFQPSIFSKNHWDILLSWRFSPFAESQERTFEIRQAEGQRLTGDETESAVVLVECLPLEPIALTWTFDLQGKKVRHSFTFQCPAIRSTPSILKDSEMGYQKEINEDSRSTIYKLKRQWVLAALIQPPFLHSEERGSLGDSLALMAPASVVGHQAAQYLHENKQNEQSLPFDYTEAKQQGIQEGSTTPVQWIQCHQGDLLLRHEGQLQHTRSVEYCREEITAAHLSRKINDYEGEFTGEYFEQKALQYEEESEHEVRQIGAYELSAPSYLNASQQYTQTSKAIQLDTQLHQLSGLQLFFNGLVQIQSGSIQMGEVAT